MDLLVGLGNPGKKYYRTRHNAGFMALEELSAREGFAWKENKKTDCLLAEWNGIIVAKPLTYMNNSGQAVNKIFSYFKLSPETNDLSDTLTVIHDDLDIELGKYRIKINSGSAGHNGVASIITHLGTKNFTRIRIGIKTPDLENTPADKFVLQEFKKQEIAAVNNAIEGVLDTIYSMPT